MAHVLMPLPARDGDPTEIAVSWRVLTDAGHRVSFGTPDGRPAEADAIMLSGRGLDPWSRVPGLGRLTLIGRVLRADRAARAAHAALVDDAAFRAPRRWDGVAVDGFDGLLLPGGHRARGMRPYLESPILQSLVAAFFAADKPVGALARRCPRVRRDPCGNARRGRMRRRPLLLAALLLGAAPADRPLPGQVRVRLVTSAGAIVVALDARHAPRTVANFMTYVDDGRLDDTRFYRASRRRDMPRLGFIQGGIGTEAPRSMDPVVMERTDRTGLRHVDGAISMAHGPSPDSATGNFSILVGAVPTMDAHGANAGYAAFGRVVAGMDVVKRILAVPTGGGFDEMKGQMILAPVRILRAERLDGVARPSGRFKTWLVFRKH